MSLELDDQTNDLISETPEGDSGTAGLEQPGEQVGSAAGAEVEAPGAKDAAKVAEVAPAVVPVADERPVVQPQVMPAAAQPRVMPAAEQPRVAQPVQQVVAPTRPVVPVAQPASAQPASTQVVAQQPQRAQHMGVQPTAQMPRQQVGYPAQAGQARQPYVPQYPNAAYRTAQPQPGAYQQAPQAGAYQQAPQDRTYSYAAPRPTVETAPRQAPSGANNGGGKGGSFLLGLVGGLLGALALVFALRAAGVLGGETTTVVQNTTPAQTIQITAESEDISVAKAVAAKALPSVVLINCTYSNGTGVGSGVILDTDGNIITNYHVVEGATSITVSVGGLEFDAEVVGSDPSSDLAVIKADLEGYEVTPIEVGDSSELVVGDWVMTVGSPFGLDQSVSSGIVSSLYRSELMQDESGTALYANLIQVDAAINPGNSGGALVNSEGKLVGICTLFSSDTQSFAGIGFAIPGNYAIDIANRIIAGEQVTHAYIGLSMQTVNSQNAEAYSLPVAYGAYIAEVAEDGPADEAGIQVGDIVIALGGRRVTSADSMVLEVRSHSIGETVTVTVMRGDEQLDFEVTLGSDERLQALQAEQREQQREQERTDEKSPEGILDNGE